MRFLSSLPLLSAARAWNCESHLTQIPRGQSQVHARGLCGTMPEDVTDGLKRSSILEETQGVRVAHTMWALAGNVEPAFANQRLKGLGDGSRFQHALFRSGPAGQRRGCKSDPLNHAATSISS